MPFDDETIDVLIGGYLSADAAHEDYEAVLDVRRLPARCRRGLEGPRGQRSRSSRPTTWFARAPRGSAPSASRWVCSRRHSSPPPRSAPRSARREASCSTEDREQARGAGRRDDPDRRGGPDRRVPAGRRRQGRACRQAGDQEGRRRGRGPPRAGPEGRDRRRAAEDGRRGRLSDGRVALPPDVPTASGCDLTLAATRLSDMSDSECSRSRGRELTGTVGRRRS